MDLLSLEDIVVKSATKGLSLQDKLGAMPAGKNGPWNENQTPVRNTSHWLITFLKAYNLTDDQKFLSAAQRCLHYLESNEVRPLKSTFYCRINSNKDFCNGLIGQAWVLKALITSAEYLNEKKYIRLAEEIFNMHDFDFKKGLWKTRNVDGSMGSICLTVNQQLWFAAIGALIYMHTNNSEIKNKVDRFFININKYIGLTAKGRIKHTISNYYSLKGIYEKVSRRKKLEHFTRLEIGYHSFNLYALGYFYNINPDHPYWKLKKTKELVRKSLKYTDSKEYRDSIDENPFALSYNPAGFEIAYGIDTFAKYLGNQVNKRTSEKWISLQMEKHFDSTNLLMSKDTLDSDTLAARIYQVTDLIKYSKHNKRSNFL